MPKQLELPLEIVKAAKTSLNLSDHIAKLEEEYEAIDQKINDAMQRHGIIDLKKRRRDLLKRLEEAKTAYRIETRNIFAQWASQSAEDEEE